MLKEELLNHKKSVIFISKNINEVKNLIYSRKTLHYIFLDYDSDDSKIIRSFIPSDNEGDIVILCNLDKMDEMLDIKTNLQISSNVNDFIKVEELLDNFEREQEEDEKKLSFENIPHFNDDKFEKKLIVMFYADYCGHCIKMKPIFFQLCQQHSLFDHVRKVRNDNQELINKYNVPGYPTFILFNENGEVLEKIIGADENNLKNLFQKF